MLTEPTIPFPAYMPSGFCSLRAAVDHCGFIIFGDNWTGQERAAGGPLEEDGAFDRWRRAFQQLRSALHDPVPVALRDAGCTDYHRPFLPAEILDPTTGTQYAVPPELWASDQVWEILETGRAQFDLPTSHVKVSGWVILPDHKVRDILRRIQSEMDHLARYGKLQTPAPANATPARTLPADNQSSSTDISRTRERPRARRMSKRETIQAQASAEVAGNRAPATMDAPVRRPHSKTIKMRRAVKPIVSRMIDNGQMGAPKEEICKQVRAEAMRDPNNKSLKFPRRRQGMWPIIEAAQAEICKENATKPRIVAQEKMA
jgi:hypothetical protein